MIIRKSEEACLCISIRDWILYNTDFGDLVYHFANEGKRSYANAFTLKRMGLQAGVSDFFIMKPSKKYFGFWMEVKTKGKKPTKSQNLFLEKATRQGYYACWVDNFESAIFHIKNNYDLK